MLARCYSAVYSPATGSSHCLLEDVSANHIITLLPRQQILALEGVPPDHYSEQVIRAVAEFHAYWWQHPRLGSSIEATQGRWWYRDRTHYARHIERRQQEYTLFRQACAAEVSRRLARSV